MKATLYDIPVSDRVWRQIDRPSAGLEQCWLWQGTVDKAGYPRVHTFGGRHLVAHRLIFTAMVGPVPAGLELDHLCRVRHCVNPWHLEAVTHAENIKRGEAGLYNRIKTHCRNEHPYDGTNTYLAPDGSRVCRACNREAAERYRQRREEAR